MHLLTAAAPLITNDAVLLGLLIVILAFVMNTSSGNNRFFKRLYAVVPPLLLLYFIPGLLNSFHVISGERSGLYTVVSRFLLPVSITLFTLSVNMKELWRIRHKAGLMFLAGSIGIIIGGPLTILIVKTFAPELVGGTGQQAVWRGLATVAGSWIGGSANMAALNEVFKPDPKLFSAMVALDTIIVNLWLAVLLYGVGKNEKLNRLFKARDADIDAISTKMKVEQAANERVPALKDLFNILAVGFGCMSLSYFLAGQIVPYLQEHHPELEKFSLTSEFFWVVILSTTFGLLLSFTGLRRLEGAGASRIGSVFLYMFIVSVGIQMDIFSLFSNSALLLIGFIWLLIHIAVLTVAGRLLRAPYFYFAVASEANMGGAVQASLIASAFHPSLAPVGVLLAVFGYVFGNYGGYICALLMQWVTS